MTTETITYQAEIDDVKRKLAQIERASRDVADNRPLVERFMRAYVEGGSEPAFATLVEHKGLVYASALRQTGDAGLAEEITQAVFVALARKAAALKPGVILSGWLFRATRFAAADTLKGATAHENAQIIERVLAGERGPVRDVVLLNAGAALFIDGVASSVEDGIFNASRAIDRGDAKRTLERLVSISTAEALSAGGTL